MGNLNQKVALEKETDKADGKQTESSHYFVYKKKLLEILTEEGFLKLKTQHKNPWFNQSSY